VDGKIVYAKGNFSEFTPDAIPILPDWSPSVIYNGYYPGSNNLSPAHSKQAAAVQRKEAQALQQSQATQFIHQCIGSCGIHGHNHDSARKSDVPVNNYTAFWGALGCSCFAF
jgi:hypothetical protein